MKKIVYFNFDVGSAIQYAGSIFKSWIDEAIQKFDDVDVVEISKQDQSTYLFSRLMEEKPDIIILNEKYQRSVEASLYYKIAYPETKIFFIVHVWRDLKLVNVDLSKYNENTSIFDMIKFKDFCKSYVDRFTVLNYKPDGDYSDLPSFEKKIYNTSYPTDSNIFNISVEWKNRPNKFLYLGNIVPHKMSLDFVNKIKETDIQIDCYGKNDFENSVIKNYSDYINKVKSVPNLNLLGYFPQDRVSELFNQYKYFVLPHDGYEPFNWTVLQSIQCGTIPLIVNDRNSKKYDPSWIDWADGLYLGTDTVDQLIENLNIINSDDSIDFNEKSKEISEAAINKFDYNGHKSHFISVVCDMLSDSLPEVTNFIINTVPSVEGTGCSSHNSIYYSVDNSSYDSSVDSANNETVDPHMSESEYMDDEDDEFNFDL